MSTATFNWQTDIYTFKFGASPTVLSIQSGVNTADSCLYQCAVNNEIKAAPVTQSIGSASEIQATFSNKATVGSCNCAAYSFRGSESSKPLILTSKNDGSIMNLDRPESVFLQTPGKISLVVSSVSGSGGANIPQVPPKPNETAGGQTNPAVSTTAPAATASGASNATLTASVTASDAAASATPMPSSNTTATVSVADSTPTTTAGAMSSWKLNMGLISMITVASFALFV